MKMVPISKFIHAEITKLPKAEEYFKASVLLLDVLLY